ncbi:MAG: hypothetical protein KDI44_04460, partial [Thiothrix sp.]|nr:hypothetical protein [Thiothrix sp.]
MSDFIGLTQLPDFLFTLLQPTFQSTRLSFILLRRTRQARQLCRLPLHHPGKLLFLLKHAFGCGLSLLQTKALFFLFRCQYPDFFITPLDSCFKLRHP